MARKCCVPGCKPKRGTTTFHQIPCDPLRRSKWLQSLDIPDLFCEDLTCVCSRHFVPSDYVSNFIRRVLRKDALPTVFNIEPDQIKSSKPTEESKFNANVISKMDVVERRNVQFLKEETEKNLKNVESSSSSCEQESKEQFIESNLIIKKLNKRSVVQATPTTPIVVKCVKADVKTVESSGNLTSGPANSPVKPVCDSGTQTDQSDCESLQLRDEVSRLRTEVLRLRSVMWRRDRSLLAANKKIELLKKELQYFTHRHPVLDDMLINVD